MQFRAHPGRGYISSYFCTQLSSVVSADCYFYEVHEFRLRRLYRTEPAYSRKGYMIYI
jgi:hypothetical protein